MDKWSEWHPIHVWLEDEDDPNSLIFDIYHSHCPISFSSRRGIEYECAIEFDAQEIGASELFDIRSPGWYLVRLQHTMLSPIGGFSEVDIETEVQQMEAIK